MLKFNDVQKFFKSWGMFPNEEDTEDYNSDVTQQGINRGCYEKLCEDARREDGKEFVRFCKRSIDAQDDAFFLRTDTWAGLEKSKAWKDYMQAFGL